MSVGLRSRLSWAMKKRQVAENVASNFERTVEPGEGMYRGDDADQFANFLDDAIAAAWRNGDQSREDLEAAVRKAACPRLLTNRSERRGAHHDNQR